MKRSPPAEQPNQELSATRTTTTTKQILTNMAYEPMNSNPNQKRPATAASLSARSKMDNLYLVFISFHRIRVAIRNIPLLLAESNHAIDSRRHHWIVECAI